MQLELWLYLVKGVEYFCLKWAAVLKIYLFKLMLKHYPKVDLLLYRITPLFFKNELSFLTVFDMGFG